MSIKLFLTGGTIDKKYDEISGKLDFDGSHFDQMLSQSRVRELLVTQQLFLVDSLDITDHQRQEIVVAVTGAAEARILISHGTDTMVQTAQALADTKLPNKTIVLFGAMLPFSVDGSDALFNFGAAVSSVQLLPTGVYVVMNGRVFDYDKVTKDLKLGEFRAL